MQVYPSEMVNNFKICPNLNQCLSQLEVNTKLAVAVSSEYAHSMSISQFYCFDNSEIIYEYAIKFLVHKNSHYLKDLNEFIQRVIESGLRDKWLSDIKYRTAHTLAESVVTGGINGQEGMNGFQGMVYVWCIMMIIIFSMFLLEKIVYKKVRSSNSSRSWEFIQMLIDPDRHFWLENGWDEI